MKRLIMDGSINCPQCHLELFVYGRLSVKSAFHKSIPECKAYFDLLAKLEPNQAVKEKATEDAHDAGFWFQEGFRDWEEVEGDVQGSKNGKTGGCQVM